jgi:galactose-1-phosphate uridylyltransferase
MMAGFEIGSGIFINTALPEETAPALREAKAL